MNRKTGNISIFIITKKLATLSFEGYTSVTRFIKIGAGLSATILDARLTPLDGKENQINGVSGGIAANAEGDIEVCIS